MEQIDIGVMLPGAIAFNDCNVNPTWKAHIQTHNETIVGFVKLIDLRKIYVECVCAVIGRELGLPIPKPILVKVPQESLPSEVLNKPATLAFASKDAEYPSFRRYFNNNSTDALDSLVKFSKSLDIAVFDEWIGNWDRNIGNILYDGNHEYYFIDHENAIDKNLQPESPALKNQMLDQLASSLTEFEKYRSNRISQIDITPSYAGLPFSLISEKTLGGLYLSDDEVVGVIKFLEERLNSLKNLITLRWGFKQQELVL
ncbi:HipA family kinase [Alteromonas macleodii]|uniref:HipA family kinase n=1 Tax=Alteromonas macleodii TaxID=28108 RepID=UPI002FE0EC1F